MTAGHRMSSPCRPWAPTPGNTCHRAGGDEKIVEKKKRISESTQKLTVTIICRNYYHKMQHCNDNYGYMYMMLQKKHRCAKAKNKTYDTKQSLYYQQ